MEMYFTVIIASLKNNYMISIYYGKVHCNHDNPMVSLKEIQELLKQEKLTWANQSVGWVAVDSVEKALQESLPNLTK